MIGLFRGLRRVWADRYQLPVPSVADQLKAERERQGRTVHDVANVTNIKTDHIRARMWSVLMLVTLATSWTVRP